MAAVKITAEKTLPSAFDLVKPHWELRRDMLKRKAKG
jgi:hypothetical protein